MKILYISNYRDGTGWGNSAIHYMLAMDSVGVEVVPECIRYNNRNIIPLERILELEKQSRKNCDIIIQHCLPTDWEYCGHFKKNIGVYFTETSYIANNTWISKINLMDEVWCCNPQMIEVAEKSGVRAATELVPVPTNLSELNQYHEPLSIRELQDTFSFYTVVDTSKRKNLPAILKAFHLEFRPDEPVSLLLKVTSEGLSPQKLGQYINEQIKGVKEGLKLYRDLNHYKKEIVMTQYVDRKDLLRLHKSCDCYVSATYGEAWQQPAYAAMALGKTPIITGVGGPPYYMTNYKGDIGGWLIPYQESPCFGIPEAGPDVYSGRENWYEININELRKAMRQAYSNSELRKFKARIGIEQSKLFGYNEVGAAIKKILES